MTPVSPSPLRVAIDATPLLGHRTGVGHFVAELAAQLVAMPEVQAHGFAVSLRGRRSLPEVVPRGVLLAAGRPIPAGVAHRLWSRSRWPDARHVVGAPVDVVHGTNYVVPPSRHAASVVTVHDLTAWHHAALASPSSRRYPMLVRQALRRGAFVHALSQHVADELIDAEGADPRRVRAVHLGIPSVPEAEPGAGSRAVGAESYVLALGTVEPRKGLVELVEAFDVAGRADPACRLVIAGADGWGSDDLAQAIRSSRRPEAICRITDVDEGLRAALLRDAAVLAYPSRYEGFGLPPLEAMSVGTPVVATTAGAIPEVVGGAATLVAPGDAAELAEALESLITDPELRHRMVELGSVQALSFSWERCATDLVRLYEDAAAAR